MKVKVKRSRINPKTTFCVVNGHIDKYGQYNEKYYQGVSLRRLPREAKSYLRKEFDVTLCIVPGLEITYFFKDWNTADQYLALMGDGPESFEHMLRAVSTQELESGEEPIWSKVNLEDLKKIVSSMNNNKK